MRYIETHYLGGKKRIKLIIFSIIFVIFFVFLVILQCCLSIFSMRTKHLPTVNFFCVCLNTLPNDNDIKHYVARGAGAVPYQEKLALAAFNNETDAITVSSNLTEPTVVIKISSPRIVIDGLTDDEISKTQIIYSHIISALRLLCDKTIQLGSEKITEQNFRLTLSHEALSLNDYISHSDIPTHSLLLSLISALNYLNSSITYTDNLTPYISVVRSVTLNLLFSFNT